MITVVGEALVDLAVDPHGGVQAHLGGGPFTTARALARLDVPVRWVGRLSADVFGRRLRAALADDGVDLGAVDVTDDPTTLALAELDGAGHAAYRFYLAGTSVPGLTPERAAALVPEPGAAVHVGTLGLVLEPLALATEALVERAVAVGSLVMCDPNVRPAVIGDRAAYLERLHRVVAASQVVKASDDDLAWVFPGLHPVAAASRLLEGGPAVVFVTRGGAGVEVLTAHGHAHVPAAPVSVVDTIGAGDAFGAGVLAWWWEHDRPSLATLPEAVAAASFGAAVAAVTVGRAGADPPRRADVP